MATQEKMARLLEIGEEIKVLSDEAKSLRRELLDSLSVEEGSPQYFLLPDLELVLKLTKATDTKDLNVEVLHVRVPDSALD